MTGDALDILQSYAKHSDPQVRQNLCRALAAANSPRLIPLLLELATQDSKSAVRKEANRELEQVDAKILATASDALQGLFDPEWSKETAIHWVNTADLVAKRTAIPISSSASSWFKAFSITKSLSRKLLFTRSSGYGILSRLFNRPTWLAVALSVILTYVLLIALVPNGDEDFGMTLLLVIALIVPILGLPIVMFATPPGLAFRADSAGLVDSTIILKFAVLFCLLILGYSYFIEDTLELGFYIQLFLYLALPVAIVRLAIVVKSGVSVRWFYPGFLSLIAIGALFLYYSVAYMLTQTFYPYQFESDDQMSVFLVFAAPVALFLAIHRGIASNLPQQRAPEVISLMLSSVRTTGFALLGIFFLFAVVYSAYNSAVAAPKIVNLPNTETEEELLNILQHQRIEMKLPSDGELFVQLTSSTDGVGTDVVLHVNNAFGRIDDRRDNAESYRNEKEEQGGRVFIADLAESETGVNDLIPYFRNEIVGFCHSFFFIGSFVNCSNEAASEAVNFRLIYSWVPTPETEVAN